MKKGKQENEVNDPFNSQSEDPFNKALAESGGPKIRGAFNKYSRPGEVHGGKVVSRDLFQSRDPDTGDAETWKDGKPVMKAKIVVQTDERGEPDDDGNPDDGKRAIYIKWWGDDLKALKEAVGKNDLEVGGEFFAKFDHEEAPKKAAFNGRKIYVYKYDPPAFVPDEDPWGQATSGYQPAEPDPGDYRNFEPAQTPPGGFGGAPATNTQPAPQTASVATAPAQPAAPAQVSPQAIADLMNAGHDDANIQRLTGASADAIAFVRSMYPAH